MKKQAYAFKMQDYIVSTPSLKGLSSCLVLAKPSGFDLTRFFPQNWRYKSYTNPQTKLPNICSDAMLIQAVQRNADCRQRTFVQNFFRQSQEYQTNPVNAKEFAQDLRKNLSISLLSNLLFVHYEIYVVKCGIMKGFPLAKKEEISIESWVKGNGGQLDLEIVEASDKFLSPYETDFIGFFVLPRTPENNKITLAMLKKEFAALNAYHKRNYIFSTTHLC